MDRLMTQEQVAGLLGVDVEVVAAWVQAGILHRDPHGRFDRVEVLAWLHQVRVR
jgi:hypothetical protein